MFLSIKFITLLTFHHTTRPPMLCCVMSAERKEEHWVEKVYSCKLKNWTRTSTYGTTAPIYINLWKHVFFPGTRKKRNREETISGRPPAEAFRKTTNIQILQLLKVMFHSQLLLNFLSDWESEVVKSFISKSDRKKSNLKKKKKRIELCRVEFVLMVVQLSLTDCKSAGHHSCYLNRLISWGLCSDIQTIYSSHWIMLSELF